MIRSPKKPSKPNNPSAKHREGLQTSPEESKIATTKVDRISGLIQKAIEQMLKPVPDYRSALVLLKEAYQLDPSDTEIKMLVDECEQKIHNRFRFNNLLHHISKAVHDGKEERAERLYMEAVKLDPLYEISKQFSRFEQKADAGIPEATELSADIKRKYEMAIILEKQGDLEKAAEIYGEILKNHPSFAYLRKVIKLLVMIGEYNKAFAFLAETYEKSPHCFRLLDIDDQITKDTIKKTGKYLLDYQFVTEHIKELEIEQRHLHQQASELSSLSNAPLSNKDQQLFEEAVKRNKESLVSAYDKVQLILNHIDQCLTYYILKCF